MADTLPPISMTMNDTGKRIVIVAGATISTPAELVSTVPDLRSPDYAVACAQLIFHLSQGGKMELIASPDDYKQEYERTKAAENPDEEPMPGVVRLHNYGTPEFSAIHAPGFEGDKLVFFTKHNFYSLPYRVEVGPDGVPSYKPMPLKD